MNDDNPFKPKPTSPNRDNDVSINFITKNIIYPDKQQRSGKDISLLNMMKRLGGTRGEIDAVSRIRLMRIKEN
ncbi:MAG: hypothetical protein SCH39_12360 [Methanosarcinales archaeon]|nr:hypothetical protein [ANME-2 cluster archaeon]MDW7777108.1 hypothetical protein [Methanosarcinales archaeon]